MQIKNTLQYHFNQQQFKNKTMRNYKVLKANGQINRKGVKLYDTLKDGFTDKQEARAYAAKYKATVHSYFVVVSKFPTIPTI